MKYILSKRRYLQGLRCPRLLWYECNRPQIIPPPTPLQKEAMLQGLKIGLLAQKLFPPPPQVLSEAEFAYQQACARADILVPQKNGWDLIEVKSSSGIKEEYYQDLAFQKYVYAGNKLKIRRCYLLYLNSNYLFEGKLELKKLFSQEDITKEVEALVPKVAKNIKTLLKIISGKTPKIKTGQGCKDCPLEEECWHFLPEDHVFILRGQKTVAYDLMERGILKIKNIPPNYKLDEKHTIQVESHKTKKAYVDKGALRSFLNRLKYPLYFLDFETIAPAIPTYNFSRPYEDIPFQFSLHTVKTKGSRPAHNFYLASGKTDPRPEILKRLQKLLGNEGSIVAYNAGYEIKCLQYAVRAYPKYVRWFERIKERFTDLWAPFQKLLYYHPAQVGKASMKNVLPALTGITYEGMKIGNGGEARLEYMRVTFEKNIRPADRNGVHTALKEYCGLDTRGMVEIVTALQEETNK